MPGSTSVYNLPYLELTDPPDIAAATRDLADAVETELQRIRSAPAAKLRQTVAQSIPNNSPTAITFNAEDLDVDPDGVGGHSTTGNTSRYTARYAGWYRVGGGCSIQSNATGVRVLSWAVNGTHVPGSDVLVNAVSGNTTRLAARADLIHLNAGDYLELRVYQSSGGALNTAVTNDEQATMSVTWERP